MCVVVVSPAGVAVPSRDTLAKCFRANPDGAGLMYAEDGFVHVRKGLMTPEAVYAALAAVPDSKALPVVIHFRIGTQGGNTPEMCHPFPITKSDEGLRARSARCTVGLAHNGILPLTCQKGATESDTYLFVRDYAALVIRGADYHKDADAVKLLERLTAGSRVALLGADGHIELLGHFTERGDGCWYSNLTWAYYADESWGFGRWAGAGFVHVHQPALPGVHVKSAGGRVPKAHGHKSGAVKCTVDLLLRMPDDLFVYDPEDDSLEPVPGSGYVAGRDGRVWLLDGGRAYLMPGCEFWNEDCDPWVPRNVKKGWCRIPEARA